LCNLSYSTAALTIPRLLQKIPVSEISSNIFLIATSFADLISQVLPTRKCVAKSWSEVFNRDRIRKRTFKKSLRTEEKEKREEEELKDKSYDTNKLKWNNYII